MDDLHYFNSLKNVRRFLCKNNASKLFIKLRHNDLYLRTVAYNEITFSSHNPAVIRNKTTAINCVEYLKEKLHLEDEDICIFYRSDIDNKVYCLNKKANINMWSVEETMCSDTDEKFNDIFFKLNIKNPFHNVVKINDVQIPKSYL